MKKQAKAANYDHVTPELINQVEAVLADATNHKYSVSRVYGAHNQVFKLNETGESCASCLKKRADALRQWYGEYQLGQTEANVNPNQGNPPGGPRISLEEVYAHYGSAIGETPEEEVAYLNTALGNGGEEGTVSDENDRKFLEARLAKLQTTNGTFSVKDKDGNTLDVLFTSEDGVNGTLTYTNEAGETKNVKAGTYTTENGDSYAVQPGGKATYKSDVL